MLKNETMSIRLIRKLVNSTKSSSALEINNEENRGRISETEQKYLWGGDDNLDVVLPDENRGVMDELGYAILKKKNSKAALKEYLTTRS